MDSEDFLNKLADVLEMDKDKLNEGYQLNDHNWDSLAVLSAISLIDQEFGVAVPTKELTGCTSVGALLDLVRRRLAHNDPMV